MYDVTIEVYREEVYSNLGSYMYPNSGHNDPKNSNLHRQISSSKYNFILTLMCKILQNTNQMTLR